MSIHAGRGSGNGLYLKVRYGMVDDFEVGLKVFVVNLLEIDFEFVFDLFGFMEEVELLSLSGFEVLIDEFIDELLELFGPCVDGHRVDSQ